MCVWMARMKTRLPKRSFPTYGNNIIKGKKDLLSEHWLAHEQTGRIEAQGGGLVFYCVFSDWVLYQTI